MDTLFDGQDSVNNSSPVLSLSQQKQKEINRRIRERWKKLGLCADCGKTKTTPSSRQCEECKRKIRQRYKIKKENGICTSCASPSVPGKAKCKKHAGQSQKTSFKRRMKRRTAGLCPGCGLLTESEKRYCNRCLKLARKANNDKERRYQEAGVCIKCGKPPVTETCDYPFCFECWLKKMAYTHTRNISFWLVLQKIWNKQKGLCAYTGIKLIPGKNASLDHKTPIKRGGTSTIENLHWVDGMANRAKSDLTHEEFLGLGVILAEIAEREELSLRSKEKFLAYLPEAKLPWLSLRKK